MGRPNKYRRRTPSRDPLMTASYAVEGENTEVEYIDELAKDRRLGKRFKLVSSHPEPLSVVKSLVAEKKASKAKGESRDRYIAVFDTEFSEDRRKSILKARKLADAHGIMCIESTPSFEFWLRLHYSRNDRPYGSQKDVEDDLLGYLPKYGKERGALRREMPGILTLVEVACENARWIADHGCYGNNTEMPSLVRIIDEMRDERDARSGS